MSGKIPYQKNIGGLVALLPDGRVEFLRAEAESLINEHNSGQAVPAEAFDNFVELNPLVSMKNFHLSAPAVAFVEITNLCNLKCKHCYAFSGPKEKRKNEFSTVEIFKLLDQLDEQGTLQVFLTGGEVFAHPDAVKIINHAKSKRFSTQIFTNGTLIEEQHLAQIPAGTSFFISFDTAEPSRTVRGKMDFPTLRARFEWMEKYGHVLRTAVSVHNHNIDDVEEIFAWCAENNYPRPQWLETHAIGRALMHPEMLIPHSEVNRVFEIYKRCMDRYASQAQEEGEEVMAPVEAAAEVRSIDTIKFCQRLEQATNMEKCGRSTVYFNSAGEVFPCSNCMSNRAYRAGSLREKNFQEIWDNGFEEFRKITFNDFNACSTCRVQEAGIWCQFRCPPLSQNISKSDTHCGATAYLKDFMIRSTLYWRERQARGIHLLMVAHNKKNASSSSLTGVSQ